MKKLLFIFLIIFSSQSFAEWVLIVNNHDGTESHYIDFDTVKKRGKYIFYWKLINFKEVQVIGDWIFKSRLNYDQIDCESYQYKNLQASIYSEPYGNGELVYTYKDDMDWRFAPPNTIIYAFLNSLCE